MAVQSLWLMIADDGSHYQKERKEKMVGTIIEAMFDEIHEIDVDGVTWYEVCLPQRMPQAYPTFNMACQYVESQLPDDIKNKLKEIRKEL